MHTLAKILLFIFSIVSYLFIMSFFHTIQASEPNYDEAIKYARDAAYIQSGAKDIVSLATKKLQTIANNVGLQYPSTAMLMGYRIYKDKSINIKPFKNPFFDIKHGILIQQNQVFVKVEWSF